MDIVVFNTIAIFVLLILTLISALLPLKLSYSTQNQWKDAIFARIPYFTAGIFLGAGLLHLLPDSVKMFQKVLQESHIDGDYPVIYLLACIGFVAVWFVDQINFGNSQKMIAIAAAATPKSGATMCRIRFPVVSTYGWRERADSDSTLIFANSSPLLCRPSKSPSHLSASYHKPNYQTTEIPKHQNEAKGGESENLLMDSKTSATKPQQSCTEHLFSCNSTPKKNGAEFRLDELLSIKDEDSICIDAISRESYSSRVASHNHGNVEPPTSSHVIFSGDSSMLPYILAFLFSIHSFIAGLALGVNSQLDDNAIATCIAIVGHKGVEAFSVGASFVKESVKMGRSIAVIVLYSIMTPLGILVGMLLTQNLEDHRAKYVESIAQGIGSGSFVYLAIHEIAEGSATLKVGLLPRLVYLLSGIGLMALLALWL